MRTTAIAGIILAAALFRILPHPPNFSPIASMALFGGACLSDRRLAFLIPLAAMALGDLVLGFSWVTPLIYACFAGMVILGRCVVRRRRTLPVIIGCAAAGSVIFFVVTNFGVWALTDLYPRNLPGLAACYAAGLPFFQNTLMGDLFFSGVMFLGLAQLEGRFPALAELPAHAA